MRRLTHLDTFSGIGGFALAAQWAGFETVAFCEIENLPQLVLRKHWPEVPIIDDIRTLTSDSIRGRRVDLLTGGFPCQDISAANPKGIGLDGNKSGLWFEMLRVIREVRPAWVVAENSSNLRTKGIDTVLDGLEEIGYAATSVVVGAWSVGCYHARNRCWIVAHDDLNAHGGPESFEWRERSGSQIAPHVRQEYGEGSRVWAALPDMGRAIHGIPGRLDQHHCNRLRALGNAIVPQVAYPILQAIYDAEMQLSGH